MTSLLVAGDFSPQGRLVRLPNLAPEQVFGDFLSVINNVDLAILNLEAPLCSPVRPVAKTGPSLHGPPGVVSFIANTGFDLVCLANNHIMDYGPNGLGETMDALAEADVSSVGAGKDHAAAASPHFVERKGRSIAILNFAENEWGTTYGSAPGTCPIDPVRNYSAIQAAKQRANHLLVITHGGHERHPFPSPGMQELFRFYIDAGADTVVNHHTHCTNGYEIYRGKPIFYSIGNFLFDSKSHREGAWTRGMAVELEFNEGGVNFYLHHFDQCTDDELFRMVSGAESDRRQEHLLNLNEVITSPQALAESFSALANERSRLYQAYLEPKLPRFVGAAQRRGWLPSMLSRRHRALLLNLIRCESHREIVIELLKRDASNSR